jgi:hypothetical protein
MQLSANFTLGEMTRSQMALRLGIDNTPDEYAIASLKRLCAEVLEPARVLLGCPLHSDSGYRAVVLNTAVGGATDSEHLYGRADDILPIGRPLPECFDILRRSNLPFDQLIFECNAWLHLGIAPLGAPIRREVLTATGSPGRWRYTCVPAGA